MFNVSGCSLSSFSCAGATTSLTQLVTTVLNTIIKQNQFIIDICTADNFYSVAGIEQSQLKYSSHWIQYKYGQLSPENCAIIDAKTEASVDISVHARCCSVGFSILAVQWAPYSRFTIL